MSLPATGVCSYNGWTFGSETSTIGVSIQPVESRDGRSSAGNKYMFRIKSKILSGALGETDNDATLEDIREQLTAYGGIFKYTDKGLGTIEVNNRGPDGDVAWGPKPRELLWRPLGDNKSAEIILQIEFMISDCTSSPYGRPMEFAWEADITQGHNRLTVRTISGYIKIPMRRQSADDKRVFDTADMYYEKVVPFCPENFRRENERRHLSLDKTLLDFSFTDVQMEAAIPAGCIEFDCNHSVANRNPMVFFIWQGNISARYKMALEYPLSMSYQHFLDLVRDRTKAIETANARIPIFGMKYPIIPLTFSMNERPQTRECDYSFSYWHPSPIGSFMLAGMWRPIPNRMPGMARPVPASFRFWQLSMQHANRPRGYTQDIFRPEDDAIVDLCDRSAPKTPRPPIPTTGPGLGTGLPPELEVKCPPENASWLYYRCVLEIMVDDEVVDHRPLPAKKLKKADPLGPGTSIGEQLAQQEWGNQNNQPGFIDKIIKWATNDPKEGNAVMQRRNTPRIYVRLVGVAVRACYDVPPPKLVSVAGSPVVPSNRIGWEYVKTELVGNVGVPIIMTKWAQRWTVVKPPKVSGPMTPPTPTVPRREAGTLSPVGIGAIGGVVGGVGVGTTF